MLKYNIEIGRVHPSFFKHSNTFAKFQKTLMENGDAALVSPFFTLHYMFDDGILSCDDDKVLMDFVEILSESYGTLVSREEVWDSIDKNTLIENWSILNAGVLVLKGDKDSGWNGSINALWYDANIPEGSRIVKIVHQFFNKRMLNDCYKLTLEDCKKLGGDCVVPNLVDSMVLHKVSKKKHDMIENLIKEII